MGSSGCNADAEEEEEEQEEEKEGGRRRIHKALSKQIGKQAAKDESMRMQKRLSHQSETGQWG